MKSFIVCIGLAILVLLFAACSMPQGSVEFPDGSIASEQGIELSIKNDTARGQGIYVNEKGEEFDIVSNEETEEVRCVEAVDILLVGGSSAAKSFSSPGGVKALIIGRRHDGYPGIWEVLPDDSIEPMAQEEKEKKSSQLLESKEVDWLMHGYFGWTYYAKRIVGPDADGGYIVVGYAENEKGRSLGRWAIDPGATAGIFWRLLKTPSGRFLITRAAIIGEPSEEYQEYWGRLQSRFPDRPYHHFFFRLLRYFFHSFRMFFLDWFESYLIMVDFDSKTLAYDLKLSAYRVQGTDNKNRVAEALIYDDGQITVEPVSTQTANYERIVIDTYHPDGGGSCDTFLNLFDSSGDPDTDDPLTHPDPPPTDSLAEADGGNPDGNQIFFAHIDYIPAIALTSGDVLYIRVVKGQQGSISAGHYAIRVLALNIGDPVPAVVAPLTTDDYDPYEDDDFGDAGVPPSYTNLGLTTPVVRRLDDGVGNASDTDIDWFVLTLPKKTNIIPIEVKK